MTVTSPFAVRELVRDADTPLTEQIVVELARRIRDHALRPGTRLPSIRELARQCGVSRFTVVEAYDRLVAAGLAQSRRGAGFFVAAQPSPAPASAAGTPAPDDGALDVNWLLRSMLSEATPGGMAASGGLLPAQWLDAEMVAQAVRAVGRSARDGLLGYGHPRGHPGLRQQIAARLQAAGIGAHPEHNLLTTAGVTHALDLIVRHLVQPGEVVLVEDPAWFVIFGRLAAFGVRPVGVPRGPEGPDVDALARLAERHRPRLFVVNGTVHNPTGYTLSARAAHEVLRVAERFDFLVVEDDTYGDMHPGGAVRLAELDGLKRVLHLGGYAKMLSAGLRVGFVAAAPPLVEALTDLKMLTAVTTPELGERVVHRILADGQYRRHVDRVRQRVDHARRQTLAGLARLGVQPAHEPYAGMFVWADCGRDGAGVARAAAAQGLLLAPGSLFSPDQRVSTYVRFSAALAEMPAAWAVLGRVLGRPD